MKYSIIIPVYNCIDYLEECIESVIDQTFQDYELILVDDGSNDGSEKMVDAISERNDGIRVFHKKNGGAASARNLGIEKAKGDYLLFIDCDDTIDIDLLEKLENTEIEKRDALIVFGMSFDYYNNGNAIRTEKLSVSKCGLYSIEQVADDFSEVFFDNALSSSCNKVFSRKTIKENKLLFNEAVELYEDLDFVLRYCQFVSNILFIDSTFYHYRNVIENNHFNKRVMSLDLVQNSMKNVLDSFLYFYKLFDSDKKQILSVAQNLYMQLLVQNIMANDYSVDDMKRLLSNYCDEKSFERLVEIDNVLTKEMSGLLTDINEGNFVKIRRRFKFEQLKRIGKDIVKVIIRRK